MILTKPIVRNFSVSQPNGPENELLSVQVTPNLLSNSLLYMNTHGVADGWVRNYPAFKKNADVGLLDMFIHAPMDGPNGSEHEFSLLEFPCVAEIHEEIATINYANNDANDEQVITTQASHPDGSIVIPSIARTGNQSWMAAGMRVWSILVLSSIVSNQFSIRWYADAEVDVPFWYQVVRP